MSEHEPGCSHRHPWTQADDRRLQFDWGVFRVRAIAKKHGRTVAAVVNRAKRLGIGPPSRGTTTVAALARETGYDKSQIRNAAREIGMSIPKVAGTTVVHKTRKRWSAISEEGAERIVKFLSRRPNGSRIRAEVAGAWGGRGRGGKMKPVQCGDCGRNTVPHYAKGLCVVCYDKGRRARRATLSDSDSQTIDTPVISC